MATNSELVFSQMTEIGSRLYRGVCNNMRWSDELPMLMTEHCREAADCEYAELWRFDRSRNEFHRLSPPDMTVSAKTGLMGKAAAEKQPLTGMDDRPRPAAAVIRSVLVMPIVSVDGELVGMLRLINKRMADGFTEWDIRRLSSPALICAVVIMRDTMSGSHVDMLTGLCDRSGLLTDLTPEGRYGSKLSSSDLSFFICDIDNFRNINENYGISAGDQLLRSVADTLSECCRPEDAVYRLGGEEFLVLMPNTKLKECAAAAESIRLNVQEHSFAVNGKDIRLPLSFGCCRYDPALSTEGNLSAADAKLYTAKQNGRNRVAY